MTRETIIPSHNCHDKALYPSSEQLPSTETEILEKIQGMASN